MKMKLTNVSSPSGAPMGRPNHLPKDVNLPIKMRLQKLDWVDGDYDEGGAYFGGGSGDNVYWAKSDNVTAIDYFGKVTDWPVEVFVRAFSRDEAKQAVKELLPNATFYR